MIDELGRIWEVAIVVQKTSHHIIFLEGLWKATGNLRIAEIRTKNLSNTSTERYRYSSCLVELVVCIVF